MFEFRILGPLEVARDGEILELRGSRERALLALLVVNGNRVVSSERLAEDLWSSTPPEGAAKTIRVYVSRLRHGLGDSGGVLVTRPGGYLLQVDTGAIDAACFEALLATGREQAAAGDHPRAARTLREALALWRGPALVDVADAPSARVEASRLEEARLAAVEERLEADLACGRHAELIGELEALTRAHAVRERLWAQRMVALYRCGRQAEALGVYQELRHTLVEELGIEPSAPLRRLETAVLRQEPKLEYEPDLAHPEGAFPAAHARHNLPVTLTPFVGRERELAELEDLLGARRLVTLTGVGGAGKTRLALQLATRFLGRFPEGVFLVDLAPLRDPGLVAFEVAASVGLTASGIGTGPRALEERLCEHLESRRVLLLFDNCEHMVQAVAGLVDALLRHCPEVVIVATSRELLGVAGELAWAVPSLSLPPAGAARPEELAASDAASLFCARARAVKPGFALSATNSQAVAEICCRLDGIPLALELACARLRILSAEQVASRLDDAFRLLTGGARTALARHQTLRATMDWSFELLPPTEQAALRRLAVFPGSFDLEAAEAVAGSVEGDVPVGVSPDVLELLAHLVDKSLVGVEGEGAEVRYRLLETVRQYAGEKLAQAGETANTRRRHRDFYLARGERWRPWQQGGALIDGADDDNFRGALEWSLSANDADACVRLAAALWLYWLYSGHELEGCSWLERCLATPPQPLTPARAASLIGLANLSLISGRGREQAEGLFHEALGLALELGDREAESVAQRFLAVAALAQGDADRAKGLADEALEVAGASCLPLGAGWCHNTLGWVAMARHDAEVARSHFERAVEAGRRWEEPGLTCHALAALAPLVAFSGEVKLAVALADESVDAARRLQLHQVLVMTLVRSAEVAILAGGGERAQSALAEALRLLGDLGANRWVADTLEMTALAREAQGWPASASRLLGACDALRHALGESPGEHRFISSKVSGCRHRVVEALGSEAYEEQRAQGERLAVPEAISYALSELGGGS